MVVLFCWDEMLMIVKVFFSNVFCWGFKRSVLTFGMLNRLLLNFVKCIMNVLEKGNVMFLVFI